MHYAASKSALRGLTEALAREVGRYDIKVNLLAPGLLDVGLAQACCRSTASHEYRRPVRARAARHRRRGRRRWPSFLVSARQHVHDRRQAGGRRGAVTSDPRRRALIADVLHKGWDEFAGVRQPAHRAARRAGRRADRASGARRAARSFDADGHAIEDFHGTQMLGHRNPAVADAVRAFLDSDAPNWYPVARQPVRRPAGPAAVRAHRATATSTSACSGSDAVEAALKLARAATSARASSRSRARTTAAASAARR